MRAPFAASDLRPMQSRPPVRLNLFRLQRLWLVFLGLLLSGSLDCAQAGPRTEPPRAAVFSERLPGSDQGLAREVGGQVQAAGYATEFVGTTVLTNPALLTAKSYELLVLP